jgi:hypothetical protein
MEPAVVPFIVSPEMSSTPPELTTRRADPPLALSKKKVCPPSWVMIVALPAVLVSAKARQQLLMMVALPAVLEPRKSSEALLVIVAL